MVKAYRMGKSERLLLTKFDETLTFGSIISVVRETGLPLSYITFGQEVPEDLEAAQAERIARLAVKNISSKGVSRCAATSSKCRSCSAT